MLHKRLILYELNINTSFSYFFKQSQFLDTPQLKTSPKPQVIALLTDEHTMSEIYPEVRLPEAEEPMEEQAPTKGKAKDQAKERPTPARRYKIINPLNSNLII